MLDAIAHTLLVISAGAWLGGVVFTTTVVSPGAEVDGMGRGREGKGEVGDRTPVCEGRDREPRAPYGSCSFGGGSLDSVSLFTPSTRYW